MEKAESGKYCTSCAKNVIDFRQLPDREVLAMIRKTDGKLCGSFNPGQLNRLMADHTPASSRRFHRILAGLLLISGPGFSYGMSSAPLEISEQDLSGNVPSPGKDSTLNNVFKGTVIEKTTHEVYPFARIQIKETNVACQSDIDGKFRLQIPASFLTDTITFVIKTYGPETEFEHKVAKNDLSVETTIFIEETIEDIQVIGAVDIKKKRWWQRMQKFK